MERDYSAKGVKFYYIYKSLAHPENNCYVQPFSLKERLMHVAEAKEKLQTRFHWICDSMENRLKHTLGDAPNSEFVYDPDGKLLRVRQWSSPDELRSDLEELVGPVEQQTVIADLDMPPLKPPATAAKGIVPRLKLPGSMSPVRATPVSSASTQPFYVKLRAEVESGFFQTGTGRLYLGFFLDPLYKVHWNNRAMPVMFAIESSTGVMVADQSGEGPDVSADADADPREFLIDLCDWNEGKSAARPAEIVIKVKYFACDDAETFCKPVSQTYRVVLERDRDGGSRRSSQGRGGSRRGGPRFGSRQQMQNRGPQGRRSQPDDRRRQFNDRRSF